MNQIGGLAILVAICFITANGYGAVTFSNLLAHASATGILLPLALLCIAALVKGAQMPFSKWLLGAMVAPTPVSALLHSSTMVKIAPFMILRLSPALKDTPVAMVVIALTGFVFVAAAIEALSQDNFKRILAHSTIALLALMIMMSAIGSPLTIVAALTLIMFHGISKSMLFLNAGILERVFHFKLASDMDRLGETGPFTSLVITIGFMSLLLPPFGAFMGKWLSIETLGAFASSTRIFGACIIVAVACGGAILSLLYFKVLGLLIARSGDQDKITFEKTGFVYGATIWFLMGLTIASALSLPLLLIDCFVPVTNEILGTSLAVVITGWNLQIGAITLPLLPLLIAFFLLPGTIVAAMFIRFNNVDRVKEYMCGEKMDYAFSSFYFSTDEVTRYFSAVGALFFVALIIVAVF
ncbi:MAG: proton-conducting transporter membrane subunit [Chitinophagales bacterium]